MRAVDTYIGGHVEVSGYAVQVACGAEHAALVTACGNVWTWGSNDHGQLGVPISGGGAAALGNEWVDVTPSDGPLGLPTRVSGLDDACVAVACGACHTLMLTRAGRVHSTFALSQGASPTNTFVGGQDTLNGGGGGGGVRLVDGTGVVTQVWWCVYHVQHAGLGVLEPASVDLASQAHARARLSVDDVGEERCLTRPTPARTDCRREAVFCGSHARELQRGWGDNGGGGRGLGST